MKKIVWILIGIVLVGGIFYFTQKTPNIHSKPVVKIGAVLPLTGNMAFYGNAYKNMYLLRMSKIPANSKYDYQLIIEDDEMQTSKAMTASQKLFNLDNIDLLLGGATGAEPGIADTAKARDTIMFSLLWDEETPLKNKYAFNTLLLPDQYISLLLKELQKRNLKNVSIIIENHKGWLTSVKTFKEQATNYGISILDEQFVAPNERDFRTLLLKMEQQKPDAYLVVMFPASLQALGRTIKEYNIKTPITSLNSFDFIEDKHLFDGVWYASDNLQNDELELQYKQKYNQDLLLTQSLFGYAALDAVINAYEQFDTKPTGEELIQKLYELRLNSPVGDVQYQGNGILHGQGMLRIIKDGKSVKLEE